MSATTNALNVGAAALPLVGPPKIVFAVLVVVLSKNAPEPPTVIIEDASPEPLSPNP